MDSTGESNVAGNLPPFFSLKWKTLFFISALFIIASLVFGYLTFFEGTRLFQQQISNSIKNTSSALLSQSQRSLLDRGSSLLFFARGSEFETSEDKFVAFIQSNWDLLELEWGLLSIGMYSEEGQKSYDIGMPLASSLTQLFGTELMAGPETRMICAEECLIYAKLPVLLDGKNKKVSGTYNSADRFYSRLF